MLGTSPQVWDPEIVMSDSPWGFATPFLPDLQKHVLQDLVSIFCSFFHNNILL